MSKKTPEEVKNIIVVLLKEKIESCGANMLHVDKLRSGPRSQQYWDKRKVEHENSMTYWLDILDVVKESWKV